MKTKIKVLRLNKNIELPKVIKKGDWIDLRLSNSVSFKAPYAKTLHKRKGEDAANRTREIIFDTKLLNLGIAIEMEKGYEAHVTPRSGLFKNYGLVLLNSIGIIDNSYKGNDDEWKANVLGLKSVNIPEGERLFQFRITLSQKATIWQKIKWLFSNGIEIKEVQSLDNNNRGGNGSTGTK